MNAKQNRKIKVSSMNIHKLEDVVRGGKEIQFQQRLHASCPFNQEHSSKTFKTLNETSTQHSPHDQKVKAA